MTARGMICLVFLDDICVPRGIMSDRGIKLGEIEPSERNSLGKMIARGPVFDNTTPNNRRDGFREFERSSPHLCRRSQPCESMNVRLLTGYFQSFHILHGMLCLVTRQLGRNPATRSAS